MSHPDEMPVFVAPLPEWARNTKFRPLHPPIFAQGDPTPDQVELAIALIDALDDESQRWYAGARAGLVRGQLA